MKLVKWTLFIVVLALVALISWAPGRDENLNHGLHIESIIGLRG